MTGTPDRWFSPSPLEEEEKGEEDQHEAVAWIPKVPRDYVDLAVSFPASIRGIRYWARYLTAGNSIV
jgi:hypothetical protein